MRTKLSSEQGLNRGVLTQKACQGEAFEQGRGDQTIREVEF